MLRSWRTRWLTTAPDSSLTDVRYCTRAARPIWTVPPAGGKLWPGARGLSMGQSWRRSRNPLRGPDQAAAGRCLPRAPLEGAQATEAAVWSTAAEDSITGSTLSPARSPTRGRACQLCLPRPVPPHSRGGGLRAHAPGSGMAATARARGPDSQPPDGPTGRLGNASGTSRVCGSAQDPQPGNGRWSASHRAARFLRPPRSVLRCPVPARPQARSRGCTNVLTARAGLGQWRRSKFNNKKNGSERELRTRPGIRAAQSVLGARGLLGKRGAKSFGLNCVQICENVKTQTPTFQFFHKTKVSRWAGPPGNPPGRAVATQGPRMGRGEKRARLDGGGARGPPQALNITSLFLKKLSCTCAHPGATDAARHARTPRLARGLRRKMGPTPGSCAVRLEWPSFRSGRLRGALRRGETRSGRSNGQRLFRARTRALRGQACVQRRRPRPAQGRARDVPRDTAHKPL